MRTSLLVLMVSFLLLLAPVALADGGRERGDAAKAAAAEHRDGDRHGDNETDDNETDDDNESDHSEKRDARAWMRLNHTSLIENFTAHMKALSTSWHENATAVREGCHGADFDKENATKENRTANAHCIRDGYKAWRAAHAAEIKELREEFRALTEGFGKGRGHDSS